MISASEMAAICLLGLVFLRVQSVPEVGERLHLGRTERHMFPPPAVRGAGHPFDMGDQVAVALGPLIERVEIELIDVLGEKRLADLLGLRVRRLTDHPGHKGNGRRQLQLGERKSAGVKIVNREVAVRMKDDRPLAEGAGENAHRKALPL